MTERDVKLGFVPKNSSKVQQPPLPVFIELHDRHVRWRVGDDSARSGSDPIFYDSETVSARIAKAVEGALFGIDLTNARVVDLYIRDEREAKI